MSINMSLSNDVPATSAMTAPPPATSFVPQSISQSTTLPPIKLESAIFSQQNHSSSEHLNVQQQHNKQVSHSESNQLMPGESIQQPQHQSLLHQNTQQQPTPAPSMHPSPPETSNSTSDNSLRKDTDNIVPNAKTTTTTQANGAITTKQNMSVPTCKNCKTQTTPLWRRDESGQVLCNACGLFLKLHGRPRPISLKSDVIKSRNRIKHNNKSSPNTPELKAKDSNQSQGQIQIQNQNGIAAANQNSNGALNNKISSKFLPKQYKPNTKITKSKKKESSKDAKNSKQSKSKSDYITSPDLLPLLPRGPIQQNIPPGTPYTFASNAAWLSKSQGTNIQSLHYPSSTPTQFVSDLNRITSPLLLASSNAPKLNSTPSQSQSSERSSSNNGSLNKDALLNAAGALDLLSHQASANTSNTDIIPGMRLSSPHSTPLYKHNSMIEKLPPISLLHSNSSQNTKLQQGPVEPTHLYNVLESNNNGSTNGTHENKNITTLPPLRSMTSPTIGSNDVLPQIPHTKPSTQYSSSIYSSQNNQVNQLPPLKNVPGISNVMFTEEARSMSMNNMGMHESNHVLKEENEKLRTRISELELVNDLYKTRINELESTDVNQKAVEAELRKRIKVLEQSLLDKNNDNYDVSFKRGMETTVESTEKRIKVES
ncbi:hypothetical protein CANINC_000786 [Pichia inconspicua]|uniref:GATA-type domain-containing protein n=1 Tax=Pichia inconspicua TaxID=52247 RepID=A0A4T0X588_9ASCO|nr:hypothetical protein CANINC_000786 [[Candida] inconspicua]